MRRHVYLALVSGALAGAAGCSSLSEEQNSPTRSSTGTPTGGRVRTSEAPETRSNSDDSTATVADRDCTTASRTPTEPTATPSPGFPEISVSSNRPPAALEVTTTASIIRPFTTESPAVVRVTFTNSASAERAFWFPSVVPFTPLSVRHGSRSAELQLVPPNWRSGIDTNEDGNFELVPDRPDSGCRQAVDEVVFTAEINLVRLAPCETLSETFRIVGHPTNETCLPEGTYRTTSTWETSEEYGATSTGRREEWELTFELSEG